MLLKKTWVRVLFSVPGVEQHLGNGLPGGAGPVLLNFELLFECRHLGIKGRSVKRNIGSGGKLPGIASRPPDYLAAGRVQFMGQSMEPANHGSVCIQCAAAFAVERAHQFQGLAGRVVGKSLSDIVGGVVLNLFSARGRHLQKSLNQIRFFYKCMVEKQRGAAIVTAPVTVKII
jgi:hypothetical protein